MIPPGLLPTWSHEDDTRASAVFDSCLVTRAGCVSPRQQCCCCRVIAGVHVPPRSSLKLGWAFGRWHVYAAVCYVLGKMSKYAMVVCTIIL